MNILLGIIHCKLQMRIIFWIILISFLMSGFMIFFNHQGIALRMLTYSFWLLLAGVALYLMGLKNENKK